MYLSVKTVSNFEDIDYNNFYEPICISRGCVEMEAVKKWSPEYLSQIFKNTYVDVEVYKDKHLMGETKMKQNQEIPFNQVIEHIMSDKPPYYYFSEIPLSDYELEIGTYLSDDISHNFDKLKEPEEELIFLGNNSLTGCHLHVNDDYILNQIFGDKTVYLFEYSDNPNLKMSSFFGSNNNFIKDNFFVLDHNQLKIYKVDLKPGNSLLIPPWWFHAVKGHGFSCSVSKVYTRTDLGYLKKYPYLLFLYYFENINVTIKNIILGILIILLVVFLIIFFLKIKKVKVKKN